MEFSPDSFVTRAMFVMILYRMEKEPQAGDSVFVDVEIGGYYGKAIAWANANGIVRKHWRITLFCVHPLKEQPLRLPSGSREPRLKMVGFSGSYSLSEWFSYAKKSIEVCGFNALIRFLFNF